MVNLLSPVQVNAQGPLCILRALRFSSRAFKGHHGDSGKEMRKTIEILNGMVAGGVIEGYAIAGAVAAIFYTEPTDTVDLDILVAFPKANSLMSST